MAHVGAAQTGGQDVVTDPEGRDRLVFHDWDLGYAYRGVHVLPLSWEDGRPVVEVGRGQADAAQ